MSKLNCRQSCKKTSQMRASPHCTGECQIVAGKLEFDCDKFLSVATVAEQNFTTCSFWDMGIKDNCLVCPLECKENKNPDVSSVKVAMQNVANLLDSLGPLMQVSGVDQSQLKRIKDSFKATPEITANMSNDINNTIKLTNYAKEILGSVMSGKNIDIAEFKKVKELLEKKYRK